MKKLLSMLDQDKIDQLKTWLVADFKKMISCCFVDNSKRSSCHICEEMFRHIKKYNPYYYRSCPCDQLGLRTVTKRAKEVIKAWDEMIETGLALQTLEGTK